MSSRFETPVNALLLSGLMASVGILGSHFAGDFFLGIDIMVTSMLLNFMLMCVSVFFLSRKNPDLAKRITVGKSRIVQLIISIFGTIILITFLVIHIVKDLNAEVDAWYFHSTPVWIIVMLLATLIYLFRTRLMAKKGVNWKDQFNKLPDS